MACCFNLKKRAGFACKERARSTHVFRLSHQLNQTDETDDDWQEGAAGMRLQLFAQQVQTVLSS